MAERTGIAWTGATLNPIRARHRVTGKVGWYCQRISEGCRHCYACTMNGWRGNGVDYTVPALADVELFFDERLLAAPLRWRTPRRIFVCSMTDLFGAWVPDEWIDRVFAVMALTPQHTFQVLTKRPERMLAYLSPPDIIRRVWMMTDLDVEAHRDIWPLPHVHLGVSVEDQPTADARIPLLLQTPAAVRFVSYEPALGPVDFGKINGRTSTRVHDSGRMDVLRGIAVYPTTHPEYPEQGYPMQPLDWLIVGCESGPNRRNQDGYEACARAAIQQAQAAGVRVFHKQMPIKGRVSHDPSEWPEDLRVREWPR